MAIKVSVKTVRGHLAAKVREISGQDPNLCFQCGLCAGSCPMTGEMEIFTRKVMHMLQLGLVDEVISRKMAYLCASCHTCEVRCPRGLDIPRVVEALRQITLREGDNYLAPESIPVQNMRELPQAALVAGLRKFTG
ncbi:MAG: 4Fe-4S dicluster domain-containing protein [Pseudomonadota bacterium]